jgi:hypothetical protein
VNAVGQAAFWVAVLASAWNVGFFAARWKDPDAHLPRWVSWGVFLAAALVAVSWSVLAGALLRGDRSVEIVARQLPVDATLWFRLAAIAATADGALLTAALLLSLASIVALGGDPRLASGLLATRRVAVLSAMMLLLLVAGLSLRAAGAATAAPSAVPPNLIHPGAALRPLLVIGAVASAAIGASTVAAWERRPGLIPSTADGVRRWLAGGWLLASLSLFADQWSRSAITTQVAAAGMPARNTGGIVLWLVLAALLSSRVRSRLVPAAARSWIPSGPVGGSRLAVLGSAVLAVAFGAHAVAARSDVVLQPGRPEEIRDAFGRPWSLRNQGVSRYDAAGKDVEAVAIEATDPAGRKRLLSPALHLYADPDGHSIGGPVAVRARVGGVSQDLLVTLLEAGSGDVVRVRVAFSPLAVTWPLALIPIVAGGLLLLRSDPPTARETADTVHA